MIRLFVRHMVSDYSTWRKGYDAFEAQRRPMGVTAHGVYRAVDNDNDVTLWHDFPAADQARAFVGSEALKNAMKNAGVQGAPSIWITSEV